jgi:hypothetical protein
MMGAPRNCGECRHLRQQNMGGTILSFCGHRGGPDSEGKPGFVSLSGPPFDWCPLRNGLANRVFEVLTGKVKTGGR